MDYEKKYEELVGQIKKAHLYAQTDSTKAVLEDILPELKENEDEKIRKYILSCCEETIKANDRGLELSMETTIKLRDWLEKQGAQNPVVKIEPKFKVGDWVVDKEGHIFKIMRVDNCFNHIIYACRFIEQKSVFWSSYSENDIRLWDITEDAKDGDVLASNRSIFIFSQEYIAGKPEAHCGIMDGLFIAKPEGWWTNEKCYPATKEQRYFLFGKMREAGYEWDAEKKELKKIEQNPAWSEEDENYYQGCLKAMKTYGGNDTPISKWIESLKDRVQPQPKQEWSEDDEEMLNDVEESLEAYSTKLRSEKDFMLADTVKKEMEWIKSLKERVACEANCTTTKQWKPSDMELEVLRLAAEKDGTCLMGLYEQLKKLREE